MLAVTAFDAAHHPRIVNDRQALDQAVRGALIDANGAKQRIGRNRHNLCHQIRYSAGFYAAFAQRAT